MPEELYLYFSHPLEYYSAEEKLEVLRAIKEEYPGYRIIDPGEIDTERKLHSCHNCMQDIMVKKLHPLIGKCSLFLIWMPIATCSIKCEFHYAWQLGKKCVYVTNQYGEVDFEDLSLSEYHKIESQTPTERIL